MSAEEKPKLEFFDDIKTQVFLVLAGVVSLTTVIPAFLNSTSEIFGWQKISWGYYLFLFLYFILPYVFYLFYCSIHDDVGYLELLPHRVLERLWRRRGLRVLLELLLPALALVYLVWPFPVCSLVMTFVFYGAGIGYFIYYAVIYRYGGG